MPKRVVINEFQNKMYVTYSGHEYDRLQIDSVLYLYGYKKISQQEWDSIFIELNDYKCTEMIVHKSSIQNLLIHKKD